MAINQNSIKYETTITTGKVRFSYLKVFEAEAFEDGKEKYSVSLIIPKKDKDTVARIKTAITQAIESGKASKFGGKAPANLKLPLRDGDLEREDDEAYAGSYFLNASSTTRPGIVDAKLNAIIDPEQLYSGCFGRASITFYAFNTNGNRGVAVALNHLQKLSEGESLASRVSVTSAFSDEIDDADLDF